MRKKMRKKNNQSGFSLVELLVAATIIIILASLGLVSYQKANVNARNAKRRSDLETVRQALILYKSENGSYPTGHTTVTGLLGDSDFEDYIADSANIGDPKGNTYSYTSGGSSFILEVDLEPSSDGLSITLTNP